MCSYNGEKTNEKSQYVKSCSGILFLFTCIQPTLRDRKICDNKKNCEGSVDVGFSLQLPQSLTKTLYFSFNPGESCKASYESG